MAKIGDDEDKSKGILKIDILKKRTDTIQRKGAIKGDMLGQYADLTTFKRQILEKGPLAVTLNEMIRHEHYSELHAYKRIALNKTDYDF